MKIIDIYDKLDVNVGDQLTNTQINQIANLRKRSAPLSEPPSGTTVSDDDIRGALDQLDAANDSDWTQDGKPAMKAIEALVKTDVVSRKDIERIRPHFKRTGG